MEELSSFTNNQMILCVCPKCANISRFSDLRIISTKKKIWLYNLQNLQPIAKKYWRAIKALFTILAVVMEGM